MRLFLRALTQLGFTTIVIAAVVAPNISVIRRLVMMTLAIIFHMMGDFIATKIAK